MKYPITIENLQEINLSDIPDNDKNDYFLIEEYLRSQQNSPAANLLANACSLCFNFNPEKEPLLEKGFLFDKRTANLSDFDEAIEVLEQFYPKVDNHALKARLADIVWIKKREPMHACIASKAYLESAKELPKIGYFCEIHERIKRALCLSSLFKKMNLAGFNDISSFILEEYERSKTAEVNVEEESLIILQKTKAPLGCIGESEQDKTRRPFRYALKLLNLCHEFKIKDQDWIYEQAIELADLCNSNQDFHDCLEVCEFADTISTKMNKEKKDNVLLRLSKCNEEISKLISYPTNISYLNAAIVARKKVYGDDEECKLLHEKLINLLKNPDIKMAPVEMPISEIIDPAELDKDRSQAIQHVQSNDVVDALFKLGTVISPINFQSLSDPNIKWMIDKGIISFQYIDYEGVSTVFQPGKKDKSVLHPIDYITNEFHMKLFVTVIIQPAMDAVMKNHKITKCVLDRICNDHPFIPPQNKESYSKGLLAGFNKDFTIFSSQVILKIENSLRYLVTQKGEEPLRLRKDGSTTRYSFKELLEHKLVIDALSQEIIDNLRIILVDITGLRNAQAHGYYPDQAYSKPRIQYLWWLILHILVVLAPD